jgi:hypothetical protein
MVAKAAARLANLDEGDGRAMVNLVAMLSRSSNERGEGEDGWSLLPKRSDGGADPKASTLERSRRGASEIRESASLSSNEREACSDAEPIRWTEGREGMDGWRDMVEGEKERGSE